MVDTSNRLVNAPEVRTNHSWILPLRRLQSPQSMNKPMAFSRRWKISQGVLMAFSLPCCQSCTSISNLLSGVKPREVQGFPHSPLKRSPHAPTQSTWLVNGPALEQRSTTGWRRSASSCTRRFSAGDWIGPRTCSPRSHARRPRPERPALVLTKIHSRARPFRGIPISALIASLTTACRVSDGGTPGWAGQSAAIFDT